MTVLGETSGGGLGYGEWNTAQRAEEAWGKWGLDPGKILRIRAWRQQGVRCGIVGHVLWEEREPRSGRGYLKEGWDVRSQALVTW